MNATIKSDLTFSDHPSDNEYIIAIDTAANELRNALCLYNARHGYQDDASLLNRMLFQAITEKHTGLTIWQGQYELIQTVTAWANEIIANYRTNWADDIAQYEQEEGKTITDIDVLNYAL